MEKATLWLSNPIDSNIEDAILNADQLLNNLQSIIANEPDSKQNIGPILGKVKALQKRLSNLEKVNWVSIEDGFLAIGHRPSNKLIEDLKLQHATHILTLLSEGEGAKKIKLLANKVGLNWLWLPMENAKPLVEERTEELRILFTNMKANIDASARIYLHCSAGIHRTGMISYAFLRFINLSHEEALEKLKTMRLDTYEGVGEERTMWGNEMAMRLKK